MSAPENSTEGRIAGDIQAPLVTCGRMEPIKALMTNAITLIPIYMRNWCHFWNSNS